MRRERRQSRAEGAAGFTMTELAVVVGIIALMAAVGLPNLFAYIRTYTIEGAAKDVASEMQAARYKAISRNANLGVIFHVSDDQTFQWVMEDDMTPQSPNAADNWAAHGVKTIAQLLAYDDQHGPRKRLPNGVRFDAAGATDPAFRYNRFGAWCAPGDPECPVFPAAGTDYVTNDVNGASVRIVQDGTGLARLVTVGTGGRVVIQPD